MLCIGFNNEPIKKYSSYKNEQFNKKLAKMQSLIKSVNETSLRGSDKKELLMKFKDMLT